MSQQRSSSHLPEAYRLNVRVIDYEHERIFDLLDRLKEKSAEAHWVLSELSDYALKHFLVEEELMRAYGYPEFAEHKAAHDLFRTRVNQMMTDLGETGEVSKTIRVFLESWLVNHIDRIDRKLARWILNHRQ